jgi:hypothetical protein
MVLVFAELLSKMLPERGNGARIGEIRGRVHLALRIVKTGDIISPLARADPVFPGDISLTTCATSLNGFFNWFLSRQFFTILVSSLLKNLRILYRGCNQNSLMTGPGSGITPAHEQLIRRII